MPSAILPEASLPIFDFSKFLNGESSERKKAANQIVDAFKTFGFVYLMDHGISQVEIETLFNWSKKFFSLPENVRTSLEVLRPEPVPGDPTTIINRGYAPVGAEKLSQILGDENGLRKIRAVQDVKDFFEMGPESGPGATREPNRYPPEAAIPGFKEYTQAFAAQAHALGMDILRCIAVGLGLEENYFVAYHEDADDLFRLLRYPAVQRTALVAGTKGRTSPHTDYGSITILFQDDVGGLEVEDPAKPGTYISATPIKGSVIVNIADFLMRWSNDTLKSNLHRVVEPPADQCLDNGIEITRERYSIPFFIQADRTKLVKCAEGLEGDGAKYEPVSAGDYLNMRVSAAFKTY